MSTQSAEDRAADISGSLTVKQAKNGTVSFYGFWRDSSHRPIQRRLGPAHLGRRKMSSNVFVRQAEERKLAEQFTTDRWQRTWQPLKGPKGDALDHKRAAAELRDAMVRREREIDAERAEKARPDADVLLFENVADEWLRHRITVGGIKASTERNYRAMLRHPDEPKKKRGRAPRGLVIAKFGGQHVDKIDTEDINAFLTELDEDDALSPRSVNAYRQLLLGIFGRAVNRKLIASNPVEDTEKRRESDPAEIVTYSVAEVRLIARILESGQHRNVYMPADGKHSKVHNREAREREDLTDATAVLAAAMAGLRQGEVIALKWRDVDFNAQRLLVQRSMSMGQETSPKSRRARTVPLATPLAQALAKLSQASSHTGASDLVFAARDGGHLDPSALRRRYNAARDLAVKEAPDMPRGLPFHHLRHHFGTMAASSFDPVAVQALMGHADARTTARYLHARPAADDAARLSRIFGAEVGEVEDLPAAMEAAS